MARTTTAKKTASRTTRKPADRAWPRGDGLPEGVIGRIAQEVYAMAALVPEEDGEGFAQLLAGAARHLDPTFADLGQDKLNRIDERIRRRLGMFTWHVIALWPGAGLHFAGVLAGIILALSDGKLPMGTHRGRAAALAKLDMLGWGAGRSAMREGADMMPAPAMVAVR